MPLSISAVAEADLESIWLGVALESESTARADAQIDAITRCFTLLEQYPFMGRQRPDFRPGLRSFTSGRYVIIYRVEGRTVLILHIFPGVRDIPSLIQR
jgi:toxin ParE1/3/4